MTTRHTIRPVLIALVALAAIALLGPAWPGARLSVSTGSVEIGRGEPPVWKQAEAGASLAAGDRVRTGEDGRAEVVLAGSTLRIYPNSLLRLPEAGAARKVELEQGSSLFDVLHKGEPFEVRTPEVVVSVKGTRFGVELDGDTAAVSVFRGLVGVQSDGSGVPETLVQAGFAAVGSDQFELSWHGADDPWDGWAAGGELPLLPREARREGALRDVRQLTLQEARDAKRDDQRRVEGRRESESSEPSLPPAAQDPEPGLAGEGLRGDVANALREDRVGELLENLVADSGNGGGLDDVIGGGLGDGSDDDDDDDDNDDD